MADTKISALADGTAIQGTDRIPVARSPFGATDNRYLAASLFATAAQGALADTAVQPGDVEIRSFIEFDTVEYFQRPTATSVRLKAGRGYINGTYLTWADTDLALTSGVAPLNAVGLLYFYAYDNAGTLTLEGSSTAPAWDSTAGHYIKTGDATRRCIGFDYVWQTTASAYRLAPIFAQIHGPKSAEICYLNEFVDASNSWEQADITLINGLTNTGPTAQTLTHVAAHATHWLLAAKMKFVTIDDDAVLGLHPESWNASILASRSLYTVRNFDRSTPDANEDRTFFGRFWMPIKTSRTVYWGMHHLAGTTTQAFVENHGSRIPL